MQSSTWPQEAPPVAAARKATNPLPPAGPEAAAVAEAGADPAAEAVVEASIARRTTAWPRTAATAAPAAAAVAAAAPPPVAARLRAALAPAAAAVAEGLGSGSPPRRGPRRCARCSGTTFGQPSPRVVERPGACGSARIAPAPRPRYSRCAKSWPRSGRRSVWISAPTTCSLATSCRRRVNSSCRTVLPRPCSQTSLHEAPFRIAC
mmetsp:Transcript_48074/g.138061  ORF Transcript_48074/g.138061 Transcript_48074/m.138061 type:complete len:206 (+) Transcript_48074:243-860(+)